MSTLQPLPTALTLTYIMLSLAFLFSFLRLVKGPYLPDRVVALDLVTTLVVAVIAVFAVAANQSVFLRAALPVALIAFLGTIAFAYYVEKRGKP